MHDFVEESFRLENSFEYILSIQVSLNGFSFSVTHPTEKKLLCFKNLILKISSNSLMARRFKEWYLSEEILQKPFQSIRVILFGDKFTLIPAKFYNQDLKEDITYTLFEESCNLDFAENLIERLNSRLIFSIPEGIITTLNETIGECEIIHPLKPIINKLSFNTLKTNLVLLLNGSALYLVLFDRNSLLFANSFTVNHANDIIYFTLTALKQLELSPKGINLFVAGKSNYSEEAKKNLNTHFASTEWISDTSIIIGNKLSEEIKSENITLFL
jgi:hypothetical protein